MNRREYSKRVGFLLMTLLLTISGCRAENNETSNAELITEENVSVEDEYDETKYQDILLDRSVVEGKMACYFLGSDEAWSNWDGTTHSGDSVLFITPDGTTMLYDCNTPNAASYIVYALQKLGIDKLDYFVNSHPHVDHLGGFTTLADNIEIGYVYTPAAEAEYRGETQNMYAAAFMSKVDELGIPHSYLVEGDAFTLGEKVEVKVYNPPIDFDYAKVDLNECSLLLKLVYGESSYLVGGDIGNYPEQLGRASEDEIVAKYGAELQADVSKMNHHGSPTTLSGTPGWLQAVNSKIYVGTMSEVPDEIEFYKYLKTGATVLHNGVDGTVLVYTAGDGIYDVQVERDRYNDYYGKPATTDGHMRVE